MEEANVVTAIIFMCVFVIIVAALSCVIMPPIKRSLYKPCVYCKHCTVIESKESIDYRCDRTKHGISGKPRTCDFARGKYHCVFKRKD